MVTIPIVFSLAPFPTGSAMNADEFGQQLIANLTASITGNLLTGQTGGPTPTTNIGPFFNGTIFEFFNVAQGIYTPAQTQIPYSAIQNGSMQIWQRNTTFPNVSGSTYTADRWIAGETLTTGSATVSRQTVNFLGTSNTPDTAFALRITVTTPEVTIGAGEVFTVTQRVERTISRPLLEQVTSLSLVLQSSVLGTFCVSIRNADASWSYVQECTITVVGMPQYFSLPNIPSFPTSTGNWGTNETDFSYQVSVCATCGATFQTPPKIWSTGNFVSTSNQTNLFGTTGNTLDISLVQHEPGIITNPFIYVPFDEDLRKCQMYYCKSHNYGTYPYELFLVTTAVTNIGSAVLTFASTTPATGLGVSVGMNSFTGALAPTGALVTIVTPTTVTIASPATTAIPIGTTIGFSSGVSNINEVGLIVLSATVSVGTVRFPVKMRSTPVLTPWSVLFGQQNTVFSSAQNANIGGISFNQGDSGFDLIETSGAWTTTSNSTRFQYTATADL